LDAHHFVTTTHKEFHSSYKFQILHKQVITGRVALQQNPVANTQDKENPEGFFIKRLIGHHTKKSSLYISILG
jgi:hypothetical protein